MNSEEVNWLVLKNTPKCAIILLDASVKGQKGGKDMGCLFFPLELLGDAIIEGWFFLMEWIIPERYFSRTFRTVLRILVWVFSALLLFAMLLGAFALISDDIYVRQIGKYMLFIPLGISAVQIIFGIIVRIVSKRKK